MPKAPRTSAVDTQRHNPLSEEYSVSSTLKHKSPKKRKQRHDDETDGNNVVDTKASRKILSLGQDLAAEAEEERRPKTAPSTNSAFSFDPRPAFDDDSEHDEAPGQYEDEDNWMDEEEEVIEMDTDPQDLDIFNRFNPSTFDDPILRPEQSEPDDPMLRPGDLEPQGQTKNLADIILAKIAEHEAAAGGAVFEDHPLDEQGPVVLPEKVVDAYTKIGHILSRYRSGPLPKAFKIIPTLPPAMQAEVVHLTRPDTWTPHAVYAATRIFISATSVTAEQFLQAVVLERIREDIYDNKHLNIHFYKALQKAFYKPAAFFKGILFPLLESGTCTLREATIVASVITKTSVPVLHSAVALSKCCEIAADQMGHDVDAAGPANLVIKALLDKRYALPYQTIDSLVFHFLRFRPQSAQQLGHGRDTETSDRLPVIWHQCLLVFAQRYRDEIAEEQREALLDLLLVRGHKDISPEIRRELLAGRGRGELAGEPLPADDGDDTMMVA
ncbi:Bystin-domain-containing protein [Microthyrium microscopicum]|uniref:Bystin-domain-containing protein n=1 Tax=Microthyrium microscopicum TaxID=703497 RepID=A0A6A6UFA9_9PEZI|nr:Bystin-domain-containing protein [Microthyrium microscopicum]